jgi:hypothetical protein
MDDQMTVKSGEKTRKPRIGLILGGIVLLWGFLCIALINVSINSSYFQVIGALIAVVAPILAAIVAVIALRHMPSAGPFLRKFVALLLLTILVLQGFYECATLAHDGSLWRVLGNIFDQKIQSSTPVSSVIAVLSLPIAVTTSTLWAWMSMMSESFPYLFIFFLPYDCIIAPYFVLLLLITPRFLAMPVFWLLVVLGVLYVVLPQRAWGSMKNRTNLLLARVRHRMPQ